MKKQSLSELLKKKSNFPVSDSKKINDTALESLQLKMLTIQQGIYQKRDRVIIVFEGFDASGKGGTIKKISSRLDPRGIRVHPIGPPENDEQKIHWLHRFWRRLPKPGRIAVFDRSWYGRVLVEKVDNLTSKERIEEAYEEINQFEKNLQNDGIIVIKIFLAITKDEQLKRFQKRLNDPYKSWKISMDDINARNKWDGYVKAMDEIFKRNNPKSCPWHVIAANSKPYTRQAALDIITKELENWGHWKELQAKDSNVTKFKKLLK